MKWGGLGRGGTGAWATCLLLACLPGTARAELHFQLEYVQEKSAPPKGDPGGEVLQAVMKEAAHRWSALFPEVNAVIPVRYYWSEDLGTMLGHTGELLTESVFLVRLNPYTSWFLDPTPGDDLEFTFTDPCATDPAITPGWVNLSPPGRFLYRDLPPEHRAGSEEAWMTGSPPDTLELAYLGRPEIEAALGRYDLLTTAVHELGHTLLWPAHARVEHDGAFSAGAYGAVAAPDGEHVLLPDALMTARYAGTGRSLPSELDVRMVAAAQGWKHPRTGRNLLVGSVNQVRWSRAASWSAGVPDSGDAVVIQNPGTRRVILDQNTTLRRLLLAQSPGTAHPVTLDINGRRLSVLEELTLEGNLAFPQYTRLRIDEGIVETARMTVCGGWTAVEPDCRLTLTQEGHIDQNGMLDVGSSGTVECPGLLEVGFGVIHLERGLMSVSQLTVSRMGKISGHGVIRNLDRLENGGVIRVEREHLALVGTMDAVFDLDGRDDSRHAALDASSGDLDLQGVLNDPFGGLVQIGPGHRVTCTQPFSLDTSGRLVFAGDGLLEAPQVELSNRATVMTTGNGNRLQGSLHLWNAEFRTGRGAELVLVGPLKIYGGTYEGDGVLIHRGDMDVTGNTSIGTSCFVMDGEPAEGDSVFSTIVRRNSRLHLAGALSQQPEEDGHDGNIVLLDHAVLEMDQDWILEGTLDLQGGTVRGGELTNRGRITGWGTVECAVKNLGVMESKGGTLEVLGRYSGSGARHNIKTP